jgi:hypothetical protein
MPARESLQAQGAKTNPSKDENGVPYGTAHPPDLPVAPLLYGELQPCIGFQGSSNSYLGAGLQARLQGDSFPQPLQ